MSERPHADRGDAREDGGQRRTPGRALAPAMDGPAVWRVRVRRALAPRAATWALLGGAVAMTAAVLADPRRRDGASASVVETTQGVRRVLPDLLDRDPERAGFEFQTPGKAVVRVVPGAGGHQVFLGDELLGPAEPEAVEAIWSSLRIASTVRASDVDAAAAIGERGVIRVALPDARYVIELGTVPADRSGVYGVMAHEGSALWVIEEEIAWLVDQPPETWLARRLLPVQAASVTAIAWGDSDGLRRGADDLWRTAGEGPPALLASEAVDLRIERLLGTRMDPLIDRAEIEGTAWRPWVSVTTLDTATSTLAIGGECPGHSDRVVVDRGPGLVGCVPLAVTQPWGMGRGAADLLETQLIPYELARVLAVGREGGASLRLRRRTGGWQLDDERGSHVVADEEVVRWYDAVAQSEVTLADEGVAFEPNLTLTISTDTTQELVLRCATRSEPVLCSRDGGLPLVVVSPLSADLAFTPDSFVERRLLAFAPEDVRGVERDMAAPGARTSVRLDFGVWTLDAPAHPDARVALDEVRVEALIAALSRLRADAWAEPRGEPRGSLRVELVPARGRAAEIELVLYEDCVVQAPERPPARIDTERCASLHQEVLHDDVIRTLTLEARAVRIEADVDETWVGTVLRKEGDVWLSDGRPAAEVAARVTAWEGIRGVALIAGAPETPPAQRLEIRRARGNVRVLVGSDWVAYEGFDWYWRVVGVGDGGPAAREGRGEDDDGEDAPNGDATAGGGVRDEPD